MKLISPYLSVRQLIERRLEGVGLKWFRTAADEIAHGLPDARFCALLSLASRHAKKERLEPTDSERTGLGKAIEGLDPEPWTVLETLRIGLVLARGDLKEESAVLAIEEAFRYADEGESRALYRSLALLPDPERFVWRAGEGCRSNMRSVFEAVALDTPFPVRFFDDIAWQQAVIKCIFIEAPLWRMWGLDGRLSPDLARMALDLADERRSAGRLVQPDLWLCLGEHGGKRALQAIQEELDPANPHRMGRCAASYALMRAGKSRQLRGLRKDEQDAAVEAAMAKALDGTFDQTVFSNLDPE